ncbi:nuclear matrix constituent protein 1-like isoform X1 [Zingiber officinale]|uniref:nuclear matrix constituent protein 1-like isoform X1 n=1 Tax=Zingiber officinale TaxID=94328 RepID=UPI001C4C0689|nr:nuclear matrix constituent protein 1-like isoform X1 [Zingiber officinale]XP_042432406.1 nuclear matrix constituent protein 1-like isoform X1 [Zingiber officinale]
MFTPQKKGWSLSPSIRDFNENGLDSPSNPQGRVGGPSSLKGKGKSVVEEPRPPQALLVENGGDTIGGWGAEVEAWRHFRDAGLLDESVLQRKDREALIQRINELEKELHEYQYNLGLLLIEKKDSIAKYEEVRQALAEAGEILKREKAAHLIVVSEYENREEKWQKDLGIEKQKVAVLEKDLRDVGSEIAEVKFTSEKKLAEAQALEAGLEEKYLEIEAKAHAADAKLAEASRRSSELDRKLDDLQSQKRKLEKEYLSLTSEQKAHEKDLTKQREDFFIWERKLQDSQKRLVDGQRLLNEREDKASELDKMLKRKQREIEDAEKVIEASKKSLKLEEDDISIRLSALASKEKEAEIKFESVEKKERELFLREEKLNAREKVEIQKLLDDHNALLDSKRQKFELEMEKRRKAFDEETKLKVIELEEKNKEIGHKEEKITERENLLEVRALKLQEMEKDIDSKSQVLKKWEESIKAAEIKLEKENHQLKSDRQELLKSVSEVESMKMAIEAEKVQIIKEEEHLKLTRQEREEHNLFQLKLKQEIENYKIMKDSLDRQKEDLRHQREKFEKEWELLDDKQLALEFDLKKVDEDREKFEKWRIDEEERITNEAQEERISMEDKWEDFRMKKEIFEKTMEREKLDVHEMLECERAAMSRDLELRKLEFENEMDKTKEAMEKDLQDRESEFQRKKASELNEVKSLSSANELKSRILKADQEQLEKEKDYLSACRKKFENDQLDIQKDIDALHSLNMEMKEQREHFVKERENFLAMAQQCKICKNCGFQIHDVDLLCLQDTGVIQLPRLISEDNLKPKNSETTPQAMSPSMTPRGGLSWLQKCSRLFNFSPTRKIENVEDQGKSSSSLGSRLDNEVLKGGTNDESAPPQGIATHPFISHRSEACSEIKLNEESKGLDGSVDEAEPPVVVVDSSADIDGIQTDIFDKEVVAGQAVQTETQYDKEKISVFLGNDSQPKAAEITTCQTTQSKPKKIRRTRTVKRVVEEAKDFLGKTSNKKNELTNGQSLSSDFQEVNDHNLVNVGKKRSISHVSIPSEQDVDSETPEISSLGVHCKRRQIAAPQTQAVGEKRYNFRRTTIATAASAAQPVADQTKGRAIGSYQQVSGNEKLKSNGDGEGTSKLRLETGPESSLVEGAKSIEVQKTAAQNIAEVQISQKLVRQEMEIHDDDAEKFVETSEQTDEDRGQEMEIHDNDEEKSIEPSEQNGEDRVMAHEAAALVTEPNTPVGGWSEDGDSDEDEEDSEILNASIGKKLWTFFTS